MPRSSARRILPALLLTGCALAGVSAREGVPVADGAHRAASAPQLLAQRLGAPIPYRNLYTLTGELKPQAGKVTRTVRKTSPNYPVGHSDAFQVMSEDSNSFFVMHATIRAKTPHLYLYLQDGLKISSAVLQKEANTFETSIYPTDRAYFGSEWRPGIDGDSHITCLVGDLRSSSTGTAGFFSAEDEYPRSVNPYSNEREMFYINSVNTSPGSSEFGLTLSHEFQHMIHWHMHPHEDLWLNEGMSVMAQVLNKYGDDGYSNSFITQPGTQLDAWSETDPFPYYGAAYLFLSYLYDHYGRGIVRDLLADSRLTSFALIDDVLHKRHIAATSRAIFERWALANLVNDPAIAHGIYAYAALPHVITVKTARTAPFTYSGKLMPYTADYVSVDTSAAKKPIHLALAAPLTYPVVSAGGSAPFWYANRGDMSDPHMERTVDLRHVHAATLTFSTWYDIEKDYDYAYVEASRDGGKTWQTLPATHTTRSNPNGASYGSAYTGSSHGWRSASVSLSAYAGRRIQLRFEYVTDDGYTGQGFVVRNIAIPAIGFHDDFTGWRQEGFVAVPQNGIAAQWTLDLVLYTDGGVHIRRVPVTAGNTASTVLDPVKSGIKKVVAVVFATAPKTTVPVSYTVSASGG